jgi:hypothetical protein
MLNSNTLALHTLIIGHEGSVLDSSIDVEALALDIEIGGQLQEHMNFDLQIVAGAWHISMPSVLSTVHLAHTPLA